MNNNLAVNKMTHMMTFHLIPHAARAFFNFARLRAIVHSQRISSTLAAAGKLCSILSEVILMFVYLLLLFY